MEGRRMFTLELLLKTNLLLVCSFWFFPSSFACSDFTLHYKGGFIPAFLFILAFLLILLQKQERTICLNRMDFFVLLFFLYMFINSRSFDIGYFAEIIVILLAYCAFRNVSVRFLYICFILIVLSVFAQLMYCWLNFAYPWESFEDVKGIFYNTGIWGGFVALCSIFVGGTGLFLVKRYKITLFLLFVLLAYFVYESASRAAWLAIIFSLFYFLYVKYGKSVAYKVCLFIGFILFAAVCFPKIYNLKTESAMGRFYIWKTSLPVIKEHCLLGTGQGGFQVRYMKRQAEYLQKNAMSPFAGLADETDNPFNEFIKMAVEYGILGLVLFAALLYNVFFGNLSDTVYAIIIRGVLWGMLVFAFFSYPFMYIQFRLLFVMCLAGIAYNYTDNVVRMRCPMDPKWIMVFTFFATFPIMKYYYYSLRWESCVNQRSSSEDEKIEEMAVLYPVLKKNAAFLTYYAYLYSERGDYTNSVSKWKESLNYKVSYRQYISLGTDLERMGKYDEAEASWKMASSMIPSRFTPLYFQIEMAVKLKKYEKADSLITLFMTKNKKVDSPDLERMNVNVVKWRNQIYRNW